MRAFVAVVPPEPAIASLRAAVETLRPAYDGLGWVAPERWHVTLGFLGDIDERQQAAVTGELGAVAAAVEPLALRVDGGGCFPNERRPQVFWAGLDGDVDRLRGLAAGVAAAARVARIPLDAKPFRPHLTLARVRQNRPPVDGAALVERLAGVRGPRWTADEIVLFRSHLGPRPAYERLAAWPLGHQA